MKETVTIIVGVPHNRLSPNSRGHWRGKATQVTAARQTTKFLTQVALGFANCNWDKASILVRWFGRHHNCLRLDQTNIIGSLKPHEDGLVDGGLLRNDRGVTWLPPERAVDKANPRVELVVTRIDPRVEEKA